MRYKKAAANYIPMDLVPTLGKSVTDGYKLIKAKPEMMTDILKNIASHAGKIGLTLAAGAAIYGAKKGVDAASGLLLRRRYQNNLRMLHESNPALRAVDPEILARYGDTIFTYAPNIATDPNLLSTLLVNAVHGEGIDLTTIKTITELEDKYSSRGTFQPAQIGFKP